MSAWLEHKERGSSPLMRFVAWLSLTVGRSAGRVLLYPICCYFILSSPKARNASRRYLNRVLGDGVSLKDVFHHYHAFSATILDRVFFLTGEFSRYQVSLIGVEAVEKSLSAGRGCILLGAHIGSFEVVRSLGIERKNLPLKVLMYPDNSRRINAIVDALNPDVSKSIIYLGKPQSMLAVKEWLDRGGMIGILGDRITHGDKTVSAPFLGEAARWPIGPYVLAQRLKAPIVLFFGLYRGANRYEIHFEEFAVPEQPENVTSLAQRYAQRLEHYCHLAPLNWFNFYDFWDTAHGR
jgi:predicted LPLAT superfamily acyltransferase